MLFGKNDTPVPQPARPSAPIDPNDFFADLDRKARAPKAPKEDDADIANVEIVGLRELPPERPECVLDDLGLDVIDTSGLIDKSALDDGQYHGNMDNI